MDEYERTIATLQREMATKEQMLTNREETIEAKIKQMDHLQHTSNESKRSLEHQILSFKQQIASFQSAKNAEQRRREIVEEEKEKMLPAQQTLNANLKKYK